MRNSRGGVRYLQKPSSSVILTPPSFDIDLPVECDDHYWEHPDPELAFKQPEDKPCSVSFFINYLKLYHIQAFALRTIVCSRGHATRWLI